MFGPAEKGFLGERAPAGPPFPNGLNTAAARLSRESLRARHVRKARTTICRMADFGAAIGA